MTKAKEAHPGQLAVIMQRANQRRFVWRPGKDTRELFGYMFFKAAIDHEVEPIVASLMSNHVHAMVLDHHGNRSDMMQQAFSTAARKRNLELDQRGNLWVTRQPSDMPVLDLEKVVQQVVYIAVQPVAAGLVAHATDWTGFKILPSDWGKTLRFKRPLACGPDMPEFGEYTPLPPPGFRHLPLADVIAFFEAKIAEKEREYAKRYKGRFRGIALCEMTSPYATPHTKAEMRTRNPRFTSADPKLVRAAQARLKEFYVEHRQALHAFRDGDRDVLFPAGTIQMARRAGACCAVAAGDHPLSLQLSWPQTLQSSWDTWLAKR